MKVNCDQGKNISVTYVTLVPEGAQSPLSVNKQANDSWRACFVPCTPPRRYKRRALTNAHKFFAVEPRLSALGRQRGDTATVAMGHYVSIPFFRERGLRI